MLELTCATKCSILHIYPQFHSQDSQHFTLTLAVLPGAAVPHMERGTTALEPRHYHDLSDHWGLGVFIPFPFLPNISLFFLNHSACAEPKKCFSLSSIGDLALLSFSIDFFINP